VSPEQKISSAETERMMKVQEVILKAMAGRLNQHASGDQSSGAVSGGDDIVQFGAFSLVRAVNRVEDQLQLPANILGELQGTAKAFEAALADQPLLILAAVLTAPQLMAY
jgi:hypothetical protein